MKSKRHLKILELIKNQSISTQEELVGGLREAGIEVTQATVSRDIKKLGLIKVPDGKGGYRYSLPKQRTETETRDWLQKMFRDFVVDLDYSENIIILKTVKGTAGGLGEALDNSNWEGVIGSVAGDDTLMLVIKPKERTPEIFESFEQLLS